MSARYSRCVLFGISWGEWLVLVIVFAIVVGSPRVREAVGGFVRGVRRGMRDDDPGIRARVLDASEQRASGRTDAGSRHEG